MLKAFLLFTFFFSSSGSNWHLMNNFIHRNSRALYHFCWPNSEHGASIDAELKMENEKKIQTVALKCSPTTEGCFSLTFSLSLTRINLEASCMSNALRSLHTSWYTALYLWDNRSKLFLLHSWFCGCELFHPKGLHLSCITGQLMLT